MAILAMGVFSSEVVHARIIDDVSVETVDDKFLINFKFSTPMRVTAVSTQDFARTIEVQLIPQGLATGVNVDDIRGRYSPGWNRREWSPIREIIYDGDDPDFPFILFRFTGQVKLQAQSSADLMSMTVTVDASLVKKPEQAPETSSGDLLSNIHLDAASQQALLEQIKEYLKESNYTAAIPLLTKLRGETEGKNQRIAHEVLAITRELNGQKAHAKAEYENYLAQYPDDEASRRVRQRLTVMLTAAVRPETESFDQSEWQSEFYGSVGQRYYRDDTKTNPGGSYVLRHQLDNDLNFVHRVSNETWSIKSQFVGSYRADMETSQDSEFIPNVASVEVTHEPSTIYARLGRQTRNSGGILGRFDGLHTSYDITPSTVINAVYGHPVDVTRKDTVNTNITFYGSSIDLLDIAEGWDLTGYYMTQDIYGVKDREAVGAELRYTDQSKSLYAVTDYDLYFSELNSFVFLGNWNVTDETRVNLSLDYRYSPVLTKQNAMQGQGVYFFNELFPMFSDQELKQLAMDRTARMTTVNSSLTHTLSDSWQIIADVTMSEFGDSKASGGVDAILGTGKEYFYAVQMVGNSIFSTDDIAIFGARYSDTANANIYTLTANWRYIPDSKFRINPQLRVDYRDNTLTSGERWVIKPLLRLDYRIRKWARLEVELGYEWYDETYPIGNYKSETTFITVGYRAEF